MAKVNRLGMYQDIRAVLDEALASSGGNFTLATHAAAVHWRQRAYKFRKHYAETIAPSPSKYDVLTLSLADDSSTVVISLIGTKGVFTPASGPEPAQIDDELLNFASSLAQKIEGEDDE